MQRSANNGKNLNLILFHCFNKFNAFITEIGENEDTGKFFWGKIIFSASFSV